jgi:predicted signal transduction protein with EAL and GGDEF domain
MTWLKNYFGKFPYLTKSTFPLIISLAFTAAYLAYKAAIETLLKTIGNTAPLFNNSLLGITVALGLICLFLALFIVAIFYGKFGYGNFIFNLTQKENHLEMSNLALLDTLTQLPNRRALMQHLEAATKRSERTGTSLAVAFFFIFYFYKIKY